MKTFTERSGAPPVALVCFALGVISILLGMLMIGFAITHWPPTPGDTSFVLTAATLPFSSIIWLAIARALTLLTQIAHNTRREES